MSNDHVPFHFMGHVRNDEISTDEDMSEHSEEDGASSTMDDQTLEFDTQLPVLHSYLGKDLEVVRGRTVLHDEVLLDMLQIPDLMLFPGQTLPLAVFGSPTIEMLQKCIKNNRTFGVLASWSAANNTTVVSTVGTTVEIYEYQSEIGSNEFRIKAKARQRFRLVEFQSNHWKATVRILPELKLDDPLDVVKLDSLRRLRLLSKTKSRCRRADAAVTYWPTFVYEQYNLCKIQDAIKKQLSSFLIAGNAGYKTSNVVIPEDPSELSFWVAQNMPMKDEHRLCILELNSPIQRLRFAFNAFKSCQPVLHCLNCSSVIGCSSDVFSMSTEGPQGTYVNAGGFIHETITIHNVQNIFSIGYPSAEFSWFPGYSWKIVNCCHCNQHMGWKFKATNKYLKPQKFWGLCRRSFIIKMSIGPKDGVSRQPVVF